MCGSYIKNAFKSSGAMSEFDSWITLKRAYEQNGSVSVLYFIYILLLFWDLI